MDLMTYVIRTIKAVPEVIPHLGGAYKTYPYFLARIEGLVKGLYAGNVGGEFTDVFANLISGQLKDAYTRAWKDEGGEGALPDYLDAAYQEAVANQYSFVDQYYRDIVDARIDKTSIEPLLVRAGMWANRWNQAYNDSVRLITLQNGGRLKWELGDAEHCSTCLALDGIVAYAKEWDTIGIKPQSDRLECHGYNCKCSLTQTDQRRTSDAYGKIEAALL